MKEKKFYLFIGLLSWAFVSSIAQTFKLDLEATMLKNNGAFKKGTSVKLVEFTHSTSAMYSVRNTDGTYIDDEGVIESFYVVDNQGNKVDINSKIDDLYLKDEIIEKSGLFALILCPKCLIIYRHFEIGGGSHAEYRTG